MPVTCRHIRDRYLSSHRCDDHRGYVKYLQVVLASAIRCNHDTLCSIRGATHQVLQVLPKKKLSRCKGPPMLSLPIMRPKVQTLLTAVNLTASCTQGRPG